MNTSSDSDRKSPLHLPTALGCLALQTLFIGMCLYRNAGVHDFDGMLSTISFSCIFLATQALIWAIVSSRFVRWDGSFYSLWREGKVPVVMALFCVIEIAALVQSPKLAERFLALSNPLSLNTDGTELKLTGSVPTNLAADIQAVCANGACVATRTIVLNSDGGSFDGAIDGLEALKSAGVKQSVVDGSCLSACVVLWAGFDEARVPPGSVIGIQGVYDPLTSQATSSSVLKTQRLIQLLLAHGLPRAVVESATAYPSTHYYHLTGAEIGQLIHGSHQP